MTGKNSRAKRSQSWSKFSVSGIFQPDFCELGSMYVTETRKEERTLIVCCAMFNARSAFRSSPSRLQTSNQFSIFSAQNSRIRSTSTSENDAFAKCEAQWKQA